MNARSVSSPTAFDRLASLKPRALAMPALPPVRTAVAQFPLERRNLVMRERLERRVRAEFLEMPGLCITLPQARRLFGLPHDACARILGALAREGLLRLHDDGTYVRRDVRP